MMAPDLPGKIRPRGQSTPRLPAPLSRAIHQPALGGRRGGTIRGGRGGVKRSARRGWRGSRAVVDGWRVSASVGWLSDRSRRILAVGGLLRSVLADRLPAATALANRSAV